MGKKEVATAAVGSVKIAKELEKECDVLTEKNDGVKAMETDGNVDKKTEPREMDAAQKEEKEFKEQKAPVPSALERPVRQRKSVKRLVASDEIDVAKEFVITAGRGTALKDIPNVAYKLSRKKTDETFKLLHTIVFGRRAKASQVKNNISLFSGFPWDETEENKNRKVKERLERCVKEKLLAICNVLDIPIPRATTKEDIVANLIEFLGAPHATTTELLSEKEQSSKSNKRKRVTKGSASTPGSSKRSAKSRKGVEEEEKEQERANEVLKISENETQRLHENTEEAEHAKVSEVHKKRRSASTPGSSKRSAKSQKGFEEEEKEQEIANEVSKISENETPRLHENMEEAEHAKVSEVHKKKRSASTPGSSKRTAKSWKGVKEEEKEQERASEVPKISENETPKLHENTEEAELAKVFEVHIKKRKRSLKMKSIEKAKTNENEDNKSELAKLSEDDPKKRRPKEEHVEKAPGKSSSSGGRSKSKDKSAKSPKSPTGQKEKKVEMKKFLSLKNLAAKEKSVGKGKEEPKEDKLSPSDDELNASVCELLKEVDFNIVTFNDILKQLGEQFNTDLMKRKFSIKAMIQAELTKIANENAEED